MILLLVSTLLVLVVLDVKPFRVMMDWHTKLKVANNVQTDTFEYIQYKMEGNGNAQITIDLQKGEHYWNPQIAIWFEDTLGNYMATSFVTNATAKGTFFSGRSADNFKDLDNTPSQNKNSAIRRVNALPVWAFKKNDKAIDGFVAPHPQSPLPDAISGATPTSSFIVSTAPDSIFIKQNTFKVRLEINVAFDENEYYSEYDFLDDNEYHSGTGLLGQPSLIYEATVNNTGESSYYLMELIGRGHHSGKTGLIYKDLSGITTAKKIVERIVVGVKNE